jgi:general stress protein 26
MRAIIERTAACIWFITDQRGAKDEEIKASPQVCLAFADIGSNSFLSLTGRAEMRRDNVKAKELWNNEAQAWWPNGPTDPDVRVLCVFPEEGEYWNARGNSLTVGLKLVAARLSGNPPDLSKGRKVRMR